MTDPTSTTTLQEEELRKVPDPCVVVIFGASGDLTHRKLMPSLFSLTCEGLLPEQFSVVGVARSKMNNDSFREKVKKGINAYSRIKPNQCNKWSEFSQNIFYLQGNYDDSKTYKALGDMLAKIDEKVGGGCSISLRRLSYTRLSSTSWARPVWPKKPGRIGDGSSSKNRLATILLRPRNSTISSTRSSTKARFTASTITWAKRPFKICWSFALPMPFLSQSGIATILTTSRLP